MELSKLENSRIEAIIKSAKDKDWEQFITLTDKPFVNTSSMKEQFNESSSLLSEYEKISVNSSVEILPDGCRFIVVHFLKNPEINITLSLHSTDKSDKSIISIWTFLQQLEWEDSASFSARSAADKTHK